MMKASELVGKLMEEMLKNGDGEVVFEYFRGQVEDIDNITPIEDVDAFGKVTKRLFVLGSNW